MFCDVILVYVELEDQYLSDLYKQWWVSVDTNIFYISIFIKNISIYINILPVSKLIGQPEKGVKELPWMNSVYLLDI